MSIVHFQLSLCAAGEVASSSRHCVGLLFEPCRLSSIAADMSPRQLAALHDNQSYSTNKIQMTQCPHGGGDLSCPKQQGETDPLQIPNLWGGGKALKV